MKTSIIITAWGEPASGMDKVLKGIALSSAIVHETVLVINNYDNDPKKTKEMTEFASRSPHLTRWAVLSQNIGVVRAWNVGVNMCEGDIVIVLNGDCVLGPDAVRKLVEPFSNPFIGVVGVGGLKEGKKTSSAGLCESIHGYCFAVRRQAYNETGGFDNAFSPLADETEFCARAWEKGWGVYIAEGVDCKHEYNISEKPHEDIVYFGRKLERSELDKQNNDYREGLPWFGKRFYKR